MSALNTNFNTDRFGAWLVEQDDWDCSWWCIADSAHYSASGSVYFTIGVDLGDCVEEYPVRLSDHSTWHGSYPTINFTELPCQSEFDESDSTYTPLDTPPDQNTDEVYAAVKAYIDEKVKAIRTEHEAE